MVAFVHVAANGECAVVRVNDRVQRWQGPLAATMPTAIAREMLAAFRAHHVVSIGVEGLLAAAETAGESLAIPNHTDLQLCYLAATGAPLKLKASPSWSSPVYSSLVARGVAMISPPWYARQVCEPPPLTLPTVNELLQSPFVKSWLWIEGYTEEQLKF
jgi:hypothetical protein